MKRRIQILLGALLGLCLLSPVTATTSDKEKPPLAEEEEYTDYIVRRLTPPPVVQISVEKPSEHADMGQGGDCSAFSLKPHHVRFFLRHAQAVSRRDYYKYYPWAECSASGTVKYTNGMRAEWSIEAGGRGILMPINGKRKNVLYFLYCDACSGFGFPK